MTNQKENKEGKKGKILHTYSSDLAEALMEKKSGQFIKETIAEAKEREERASQLFPYSSKNLLFGFLGLLLLIGAFFVLGFAFKKPKMVVLPPPTLLIITDENIVIPLKFIDRRKMLFLLEEKTRQAKGVSAFFFATDNKLISQNEFFSFLAPRAPAELNLFTVDYLLGTNGKSLEDIFIILQTNRPFDFRLALQKWEETMLDDLAPVLAILPRREFATFRFSDDFILNLTARTIKKDKDLILGYAYLDERTIIIGRNLSAFAAGRERFFQEQLRRGR